MTIPAAADVTLVTGSAATEHHSYVDWPAIIAGVVLASAISILMLAFGSAVGLNFTNFDARPDANPIFIAIAAASWFLWVIVSSFMAGAYLTGRLRRRFYDSTPDEVDVRDGAHGLLVWAGGLVLGAVLAASGIGALAGAVGSAAATATEAASNVAGGAAEGIADDPNAYMIDTLFRAAPAAGTDTAAAPAATDATAAPADTAAAPATDAAATTAAPAATTTPAAPATESLGVATANDTADNEAVRGEVGRIFAANTVTGEFSADDRAYLAQTIASETGLSQADAEARVDQAITTVETARTEAAEAAETARRTAVIAAFLVAASLLASAVAAYWAAHKGGQHRDEKTAFPQVFRRW